MLEVSIRERDQSLEDDPEKIMVEAGAQPIPTEEEEEETDLESPR